MDGPTLHAVERRLTAPTLDPERDGPEALVCLVNTKGPEPSIPSGLVPLIQPLLPAGTRFACGFPDTHWRRATPPPLQGLTLRDEQKTAWRAVFDGAIGSMQFPRGIIAHATGTGKTAIEAALAASLRGPVLVVAPQTLLAHQLAADIAKLVSEEVGILGGGAVWNDRARIQVATIQSLLQMGGLAQPQWRELQAVLLDECHRYGTADVWRAAIEGSTAPVRVGFSGTPWRTDKPLAGLQVMGLLGPVLHELTPGDAIEADILPDVQVTMVPSEVPRYVTLWGQRTFLASVKWRGRDRYDGYSFAVIDNVTRNNLIVALARRAESEGKTVLVLVQSLRHGAALAAALGVPFLDGATPMPVRQSVVSEYRAGTRRLLVASTIFDEGINIPAIDFLILGGGGKSPIKALQRVGRGLRKVEGKRGLAVVDFHDVGHPVTLRHSLERRRAYGQAGYPVQGAGA